MTQSDGQGRFYIKGFGDCAEMTGKSEGTGFSVL
jgi:hypothetical protein